MVRGFFAVFCGFSVMLLVVMVGTVAAVLVMFPGTPMEAVDQLTPTPGYIAVNLLLSAFSSVLGGMTARWIGGNGPSGWTHVRILAVIVFAMAVPQMVTSFRQGSASNHPLWYCPLIVTIGTSGVLLGGRRRPRPLLVAAS